MSVLGNDIAIALAIPGPIKNIHPNNALDAPFDSLNMFNACVELFGFITPLPRQKHIMPIKTA